MLKASWNVRDLQLRESGFGIHQKFCQSDLLQMRSYAKISSFCLHFDSSEFCFSAVLNLHSQLFSPLVCS